jgi:GAF domain-containing protein
VSAEVDAEVAGLRAVLRDLVALSSIPVAWVGREPLDVVDGLADTLTGLLDLDFVSVRLCDPRTAEAVEATLGDAWKSFPEWMETHLVKTGRLSVTEIVPDVDGSESGRGVVIPLGLDAEAGVVAAACDRADFPTETDRLLLRLAANEAATAFQNACLIVERDRAERELRSARDDLETTVAEQTAEQAALRRVATLVARGATQEEVFTAAVDEVGQLPWVDLASICRYESDGTITFVASWGRAREIFPVGGRLTLAEDNLGTIVLETGRSARIDHYADTASGPIGLAARHARINSSLAAPIKVEGRLWGVIAASSVLEQPLPDDTEARLASFTELLGTAIANAESRAELAQLAEEQAALRRVATLVARRTPQVEVFDAVTEEVGRLFSVEFSNLSRYEPDGTITLVAIWARTGAKYSPVRGLRLGGHNLATIIFDTGLPARINDYDPASGPIGEIGRGVSRLGLRSSVAAPITVEGRLWGFIALGSTEDQPLLGGIDARLANFTELVATAVSNAESRAELAQLADEQAALRKVATLVARRTSPVEVFDAVTEEVGRLFPVDFSNLTRYEPDGTITSVATWGEAGFHSLDLSGLLLGGRNLATLISETGRLVRIDDYGQASGPVGTSLHRLGLRSAVGAPITVEGLLWGFMALGSTGEQRLPADVEARLGNFTELVATAIANAQSRAELTESRARIVAAADDTRRRIERDLHDGVQQQLVTLGLKLRSLASVIPAELEDLHADLGGVASGLEDVLEELRELSRGIHPAVLSRGGLEPAIKTLARRSPMPVEVRVRLAARLPESIEVAAYYVVAEALTNVVRHAHASSVAIDVDGPDGGIQVSVADDGIGGANPARGSGLVGLRDRLDALGAKMTVSSPPGEGTAIVVDFPMTAPLA